MPRRDVGQGRPAPRFVWRLFRPGGLTRAGAGPTVAGRGGPGAGGDQAMPSRRPAVPPRIASRSASVRPGVFITRSTSVLVQGNG